MQPNFKIRCSSIGGLMTEPRSKSELLSETAKSVVKTWMLEQLYSRSKQIKSKYLTKGMECENDSIALCSEFFGWGGSLKNTERKENEFITGECDVVLSDRIVDIKNSFSEQTFPLFENDAKNKNYIWQGIGYCDLWAKPIFQLVYTLMDAPDFMIEQEAKKRLWAIGETEIELDFYNQVKYEMTYSNLPIELRIKSYEFEHDKDKVFDIYDKVAKAKQWIKEETNFYELLK